MWIVVSLALFVRTTSAGMLNLYVKYLKLILLDLRHFRSISVISERWGDTERCEH